MPMLPTAEKPGPFVESLPRPVATLGQGFVEKHLQRCRCLWPVVGAYLSPKRMGIFGGPTLLCMKACGAEYLSFSLRDTDKYSF